VLERDPEIGAKDLRRCAGNSDAKAGGAEMESNIRFPMELLLACPSVEHNTKNLSTMFLLQVLQAQANDQEIACQLYIILPPLSKIELDFLNNTKQSNTSILLNKAKYTTNIKESGAKGMKCAFSIMDHIADLL